MEYGAARQGYMFSPRFIHIQVMYNFKYGCRRQFVKFSGDVLKIVKMCEFMVIFEDFKHNSIHDRQYFISLYRKFLENAFNMKKKVCLKVNH